MDSLGQHPHRLADVDGGHGYTPTWSADSHKIAFVVRTNEHDRRADTDMQSLQSAIVDHDKPWYVQDGLFVRYDGAKWKNVPVGSCTPRVNCYDGTFFFKTSLPARVVLNNGREGSTASR